MSDEKTSVAVSIDTWKKLNQRKNPKKTFDDVIRELLEEAEGADEE